MDRHVSTLHEIVTRGLNTNSYKFALWRALANLASRAYPAGLESEGFPKVCG